MRAKILLELQLYVSLAIGAHLVAYFVGGSVSHQYLATFLLAFAASLVAMVVIRERTGMGSTMSLARVKGLPNEEAVRRAEEILGDRARFRCVVSPPENTSALNQLAPILRSFFERYAVVESVVGEVRLTRAEIGASTLNRQFIKIGSDIEHTEIVVRAGQEEVFQIDGTEAPNYRFEGHPTVYHWILRVAEDLYS